MATFTPIKMAQSCAANTTENTEENLTPSETDYAYVAGLIDGEGCFVAWIGKDRGPLGSRSVIKLTVSNTNLPALEWCQKMFGGKLQQKSQTNLKWKSCWHWHMGLQLLPEFLPLVIPYLKIKQAEAILMLEYAGLRKNGGMGKRHPRRIEIVKEITNLKKVSF